ncbi:hypothetical protein EYF80_053410 [Liparis tanakae]|uniref:Uncharacterized protein n=1 Tax=Liparis tanakae TaxID=230148 RepID=A0A4Z2F5B4_9TELE|nr:hypothetical protein EYF80_053410 [Liparis tanakae]
MRSRRSWRPVDSSQVTEEDQVLRQRHEDNGDGADDETCSRLPAALLGLSVCLLCLLTWTVSPWSSGGEAARLHGASHPVDAEGKKTREAFRDLSAPPEAHPADRSGRCSYVLQSLHI